MPFFPSVQTISSLLNQIDFYSIYFLQAFHKPVEVRKSGQGYLYASETLFASTYIVAMFIDSISKNPSSKPEKIFYASSRLALQSSESLLDVRQGNSASILMSFETNLGMNEFSPYSLAKLCGSGLLFLFAQKHGISVFNLYFYNHESHLRPASFFLPRLYQEVKALAKLMDYNSLILVDKEHTSNKSTLNKYNLSNLVDIGHCSQFMRTIAELTDTEITPDFYNIEVATGNLLPLRDVVYGIAEGFGLSREIVNEFLDCSHILASSDHPKACLSFLERHKLQPPSLCGFELGLLLSKDYQRTFKPNGLLDTRLFSIKLY